MTGEAGADEVAFPAKLTPFFIANISDVMVFFFSFRVRNRFVAGSREFVVVAKADHSCPSDSSARRNPPTPENKSKNII
ncbi:hypothetical protein [Lactococcus fujiensis]|uniref:Uncharacterized protein n=1 Tax=Lactococcus fujiensis JCM 16395 TaxID=1291764 RepID=A0A2A5RQ07_9LACT|nr:hypothetical protein RT41_GL000270 [Lactococcus fujiensis JCM 16395]